jgi:hypothetical protein
MTSPILLTKIILELPPLLLLKEFTNQRPNLPHQIHLIIFPSRHLQDLLLDWFKTSTSTKRRKFCSSLGSKTSVKTSSTKASKRLKFTNLSSKCQLLTSSSLIFRIYNKWTSQRFKNCSSRYSNSSVQTSFANFKRMVLVSLVRMEIF